MKKSFPAALASLAEVREMVGTTLKEHGLSRKASYQIILAVEEACANAIEHALASDPSKVFSIEVEVESGQAIMRLEYGGNPFDPTEVKIPTGTVRPEEMDGFGLILMRKLMDEISYKRSNEGKNILLIKKLIQNT